MNGTLLGTVIRTYRQRQRQIHNGKPWTLDDLAVATNDDKAHLSRIERGTILPNRATLLRLAKALELTRPEIEYLLRLAGLSPIFDPPDQRAANQAINWLAKQSRNYLTPFTLYSIDMRVWYTNALWLRLMGMTPGRFRNCMQGRHLAHNQIGPCTTCAMVEKRYGNYADIKQRAVTRFRAAMIEGHIPQETVTELLQDAQFRSMWDAGESHLPNASLTGEQSFSEINYPGRGVLRFDTWWCPLQIDHRFLVVLHIPHDIHTREAIEAIRHDARPDVGEPCMVHRYGNRPEPAATTIKSPAHNLAAIAMPGMVRSYTGVPIAQ
jgi:transcriptional regulator with XRE-family HTH domain